MADRWMIRGTEYTNCNCDWGCPCQFGAKSTHGHCETMMCGHIEQGYFNDTNLDGLDYAVLMSWPGEVAEGNGTQQVIISQLADPTQREALRARRIRSTASVPFIRDTSHTATIEFQVKYQSVEMRSGWAAMINSS